MFSMTRSPRWGRFLPSRLAKRKTFPNSTRQSIFGSIERSSRLDEIAAPVALRLAFQTTTYLMPSGAPGADTFDWAEQPPEYEHLLY